MQTEGKKSQAFPLSRQSPYLAIIFCLNWSKIYLYLKMSLPLYTIHDEAIVEVNRSKKIRDP